MTRSDVDTEMAGWDAEHQGKMHEARLYEKLTGALRQVDKARERLTVSAQLVRDLSYVRMGVTEQNVDDVGVLDRALVAARHDVAARAQTWLESLSDLNEVEDALKQWLDSMTHTPKET